jgi:hypothetical protein
MSEEDFKSKYHDQTGPKGNYLNVGKDQYAVYANDDNTYDLFRQVGENESDSNDDPDEEKLSFDQVKKFVADGNWENDKQGVEKNNWNKEQADAYAAGANDDEIAKFGDKKPELK